MFVQRFRRSIRPTDWTVFLKYSWCMNSGLYATNSTSASPSLTDLELGACSFRNATSILKSYKPDSVVNLMVESLARKAEGAYTDLFSAASTYCPKLGQVTLTNLSQGSQPNIRELPHNPLPPTFLQPLFQCSHLTSLTLNNPVPLYLDLATITALVKALPKLCTLCLLEESVTPPTLPLSSLVALALLCPSMERLTLYIDTSDPSTPLNGKYEPETKFQSLKVLNIGPSPLLSPAPAVASLLTAILPKGCTLDYMFDNRVSDDIAEEKSDKWEPVFTLVAAVLAEGQGSN